LKRRAIERPATLARRGRIDGAGEARAWLTGKRSAATRRSYLGDLADLGRFLLADPDATIDEALRATPPATLTQIAEYRDHSLGIHRPATTARRIAAARAFFRYLQSIGARGDNPAAYVEAPRVNVSDQRRPALEASDLRRMLAVATSGRRAQWADRNTAILRLLAGIGLRSAELLGIRREDFDRPTSTILVRGKRGTTRRLDVPKPAIEPLGRLCDATAEGARVFQFSRERLRQLVTTWERLAGVPISGPHTFRRTMATLHFDRGGSGEQLRRTLGHEDYRTTARYDTRREGTAVVDW